MNNRTAAVPTAAKWYLLSSVDPVGQAQQVTIRCSPFLIGRHGEGHLCLACRSVSNRHAELLLADASLWVRDLRSTNGTYVNGVRITGAKELGPGDFLQFGKVAFRVCQETARQDVCTVHQDDASDQALALIQFDKLMTDRSLVPFFQPIVAIQDGSVFGYEVLIRSRLFGLQSPGSMFTAASTLALEAELSRLCRSEAVAASGALGGSPMLFLNTHPTELIDAATLTRSLRELREQFPATPITLEVHEAAATQADTIRELRDVLSTLTMSLAYDDFGAGQARLVELVEAPPDYLKFDMSLVRGIATASIARQQMLMALVGMARDLGIRTLAEGVESEADSRTCQELGFELGQGYHYGRPAPAKHFAR
jgi:EAL domain-containing protein (putative c-di-GMP-specific phosphodiesterase class I)